MAIPTKLFPYFFFKGDAREAMEYYQSVLGGELTVQTYGDIEAPYPPDWVVNAQLITDDLTIMASDAPDEAPGAPLVIGNNIQLSLAGTDDAYIRGAFEALAKDGEVTQPIERMFWGDDFGSVKDKWGAEWLVSITPTDDGE
jgi:PhnB protein